MRLNWPNWQWRERFGWRPREQRTVAVIALLLSVVWYAGWRQRGGAEGRLVPWSELTAGAQRPIAFRVDINRADWPELAVLPRIGETLARRIVSSRESAGPFESVEQLRRVRGIGPKTVDLIRPYATVQRGPSALTEASHRGANSHLDPPPPRREN